MSSGTGKEINVNL